MIGAEIDEKLCWDFGCREEDFCKGLNLPNCSNKMDITRSSENFPDDLYIHTSNVMNDQLLALMIVQYVHIHIKQIFNIFSGKDVVPARRSWRLVRFHGDDVVRVGGNG